MLTKMIKFVVPMAALTGVAFAAPLTASAAPAAPTPLQVTLSASGGGSAVFDAHGNPVLTPGSASGTYGRLAVNLRSVGYLAPKIPPSFTTDNYAAGSPRWVIELANGNFIDGYPAQLGSAAKADFTGDQWAVGNSGSYGTYQAALNGANDPLGNVRVTDAFIVADADQAAGTHDTLTAVQYGGLTVGGGTVTVYPVAAQAAMIGVPFSLRVSTYTTSTDKDLTCTAAGLPAGLSISPAGVISGTPRAGAHGGTVTVTAKDRYGDAGSTSFALTVSPFRVTLSGGRAVNVNNNRAEVVWTAKPAAPGGYKVVINGPNFAYRTNVVHVTQAYYSGLAAGHTYTVYVTPLGANGQPVGPTGHVTFITTRL